MTRKTVDIFISGGGIAGLIAAASFARLGFSVVLADPAPPVASANVDGSDLRSTAFLEPARALLEDIALWETLAPHATPLETLRVIDTQDQPPQIRTDRAFQASDLGYPAFGWNLPNWLTRHTLTEKLSEMGGVELCLGVGFRAILTREREAIVTLSDNRQIRARLAIAADGRNSPLRDAVGIDTKTTRYGQKALAFVVTHETTHDNISTELYLSGGAFTLVPLPDHDGNSASAVVWMNDGPVAAELMSLSDAEFSAAATTRSCGILGNLKLASPRRLWPIVTQSATRLIAERTAIIAEAAHVLPPIGAQGLNTSLHDVATLAALAKSDPDSIGTPAFLASFAKAREGDLSARARAIDLYNRICKSDEAPVQALRSLGLKLAHDVAPLRKRIMLKGLGG